MPHQEFLPVLLLDHHKLSKTVNCHQVFHKADKDKSNPIITTTEPWEGRGPYTWGTRILKNPDTNQYDFYYVGYMSKDNHYRWGLAVSDDGFTWKKPALNIETYDEKPARNMLTGGPFPDKAVRSVVRDPRPDCPDEERYKAIRFTYSGEYISFSPDGRTWTEEPSNPIWNVPSDMILARWDSIRSKFTAYYKVWELTGETPDSKSNTGFRKIKVYLPHFKRRTLENGLEEVKGPIIHFHKGLKATVTNETLLLRNGNQGVDDGGGGPLTGAWHTKRVIAWAESADWRNWHNEQIVLTHDEYDRPDTNIQYLFVSQYGGYYLGFLTVHDERGIFEQQLAFSHDGINWSRPWRESFIGIGQSGDFDSGMVLGLTDPIFTDTQLIFYYGGFNTLHYLPTSVPWQSAIGRAFLRIDGFASWESLPNKTATLETQSILFNGDTLWVNANAKNGMLRVEALDDADCIIEGFDEDSCLPINIDTMEHPGCRIQVQWNSHSTELLKGLKIRLRFIFENTKLYSYTIGSSFGF